MKMNKLALTTMILGSLVATSAFAAEGDPVTPPATVTPITVSGGQITFNGEITQGACSVKQSDGSDVVKLDTVRASLFTAKDQAANARQPFNITLADCDTSVYKNVSVSFTGQSDAVSPNLLANNAGTGAASNVGLQIYGPDNAAMTLGTGQSAPAALSEGQEAVIPFSVDYVSTAASVTAGKVQSVANFMLTYN
ncbi:fimbrial protein [Utexia brackfieldae]|uniref:fimbrial protein n=1 Tax=Utexia brackfieldae TaxID=3074108 RepID=UPI00370DB418